MNAQRSKITALILAAGEGRRFSAYPLPKHLVELHGRPIITYCLDIYQKIKIVDSIVLVIHDKYNEIFDKIAKDNGYTKVKKIVIGGEYRQDSIYNGLRAAGPCDLVVIQNGVAIFTAPELIESCIQKAYAYKAVTAFLPEEYTSFMFTGDKVDELVDRTRLGHVRDPQVFSYPLLLSLHEKARKDRKKPFTNDVFMAKEYGQDVYLVESHPYNFKITTDIDIRLAKTILEQKDFHAPPSSKGDV